MVEKKEVKAVKAKARTIRTSPRKLNLVAESIRGLAVGRALSELSFSNRRVAGDVKKSSDVCNCKRRKQSQPGC